MSEFLPNGITFDGLHSYKFFGLWLAARPDLGSPEPKLNTVEIQGADGSLDFTEANSGEVKFHNREMHLYFSAMVPVAEQEQFKAKIRNNLHGVVVRKIILDEDPEWYYTGRCTVDFPDADLKPWKLHCTITVDAYPYAAKLEETVVDLNDQEIDVEMQRVERAKNDSVQNWNSNFMLGTREFPAGISSAGFPHLIVTIPDNPVIGVGGIFVQVIDADDHVFQGDVTYTESMTEFRIDFSSITQAGVDLTRVYRVLVSGIGGCGLYTEFGARHYTVWNTRRSTIPVFDVVAEDDVTITVNGRDFVLESGTTQNDEIVLGRIGENDVYVPLNTAANITRLTMRYREEKL